MPTSMLRVSAALRSGGAIARRSAHTGEAATSMLAGTGASHRSSPETSTIMWFESIAEPVRVGSRLASAVKCQQTTKVTVSNTVMRVKVALGARGGMSYRIGFSI